MNEEGKVETQYFASKKKATGIKMKFFNDEFKKRRKELRYTATDYCKVMGIARTTLWEWESGRRVPSEAVIRRLAVILKTDVNAISNLKEELKVENADFSDSRHAVGSLFNNSFEQRESQFGHIINEISKLKGELDQAAVIINALLTTMHTMFYIKDANLKYVIANSNFLLNLSLPENYISKGHDDKTFFPAKEAKDNTTQDKEVLYSKKPVITQEAYIPGTRKKKWGLISKIPIIDSQNNAVGIVGTFLDITERKNKTEINNTVAYIERDITPKEDIEYKTKICIAEALRKEGISPKIILKTTGIKRN